MKLLIFHLSSNFLKSLKAEREKKNSIIAKAIAMALSMISIISLNIVNKIHVILQLHEIDEPNNIRHT